MAFDSEFLELMTTPVWVSTMVGFDAYGDVSFSTSASTYWSRISDTPKVMRDLLGEEVVATHTVWLASTEFISATSKFSWADASGSTTEPNLISIERKYDEDGLHHHKLYFGAVGGGGRV